MVNRNVMRFAERFVYANTYSTALRDVFTRTKQEIMLGVNAFIPIWEGKLINYE